MNDKILGAIASALQIDASELSAALKDGEAFLPDDQLAEKLKDVAAERLKAAKDAQHKRGQREIGDSIEKWAKAKGFSNDEKLKGTALLDAVFDTVDSKAPEGNDPTKFTKEELSLLNSFLNRLIDNISEDAPSEKAIFEMMMKSHEKGGDDNA